MLPKSSMLIIHGKWRGGFSTLRRKPVFILTILIPIHTHSLTADRNSQNIHIHLFCAPLTNPVGAYASEIVHVDYTRHTVNGEEVFPRCAKMPPFIKDVYNSKLESGGTSLNWHHRGREAEGWRRRNYINESFKGDLNNVSFFYTSNASSTSGILF